MTKSEQRKQRQAEHAARVAARAAVGDTRTAHDRRLAVYLAEARAKVGRRRKSSTRRPVWGSQEWAETRGDDLGESPDY